MRGARPEKFASRSSHTMSVWSPAMRTGISTLHLPEVTRQPRNASIEDLVGLAKGKADEMVAALWPRLIERRAGDRRDPDFRGQTAAEVQIVREAQGPNVRADEVRSCRSLDIEARPAQTAAQPIAASEVVGAKAGEVGITRAQGLGHGELKRGRSTEREELVHRPHRQAQGRACAG